MIRQYHLTDPAIHDIEQIADYIARTSSLSQADRCLSRLDAKFAKISQFPNFPIWDDSVTKFYPGYVVSQWINTSFHIPATR